MVGMRGRSGRLKAVRSVDTSESSTASVLDDGRAVDQFVFSSFVLLNVVVLSDFNIKGEIRLLVSCYDKAWT